ncbi:hypothetical protein CD591_05805 [Salmonella enterica]|nr:hypothetical protein [Salmonella enterica]
MTTITKEEVKAFIEQIESDLANGWEAQIFELKLARIALASLDAKPVAWECGENIILFNPDTVEAYAKRAEISPKPLYAAPPVPVVPDDGRAEFETWMLKKWGRERQEYDFAMGKFLHGENYADSYTRHMWKAWTESRVALLQSKYRDLSQPVDHQISEYEKIMGQAGNSPVIPGVYLVDINTDHQH